MAKQFRLIVVTPETTLLDEMVDSVRLPLFDGMAGILPGHAPIVGRLGFGNMTVLVGPTDRVWFVDGGFVQVVNDVVSVLTNRAISPKSIDLGEAQRSLEEANTTVPNTPAGFDAKDRNQERARKMIVSARTAS